MRTMTSYCAGSMEKVRSLIWKLLSSKSLWSGLTVFLRLGSGLVVLPLALRLISQEEIGLYYTFVALTGAVFLLDVGMMSTVSRSVAYAWSGADTIKRAGIPNKNNCGPNFELLAKLVAVIGRWYTVLGVSVATLLLSFGSWFLWAEITKSGLNTNLIVCWIVFATGSSAGLIFGFWPTLLHGIGEMGVSARYNILTQLFALVVLIVGLLLGWRLWAYAISACVSPLPLLFLCRRRYMMRTEYSPVKMNWAEYKELLGQLLPMSWRQGVLDISQYATARGMTIIVTSTLGLGMSGSFGLSLYVVSILSQVASVPIYVVFPDIAMRFVEGNLGAVRRLFYIRTYLSLGLMTLGCLMIFTMGDFLLDLIGSKSRLLASRDLILVFVIAILDLHQIQFTKLVIASNRNPFWLIMMITSTVTIFFGYFAVLHWGVFGLLLVKLVCSCAMIYWFPVREGVRLLK